MARPGLTPCCACGARHLDTTHAPKSGVPIYHVLADGALVCARCVERITDILRGVLLAHIEGWPTERVP